MLCAPLFREVVRIQARELGEQFESPQTLPGRQRFVVRKILQRVDASHECAMRPPFRGLRTVVIVRPEVVVDGHCFSWIACDEWHLVRTTCAGVILHSIARL